MRKLVLAAITAAGVAAIRKAQQTRAEQELWAEATDPVTPPTR